MRVDDFHRRLEAGIACWVELRRAKHELYDIRYLNLRFLQRGDRKAVLLGSGFAGPGTSGQASTESSPPSELRPGRQPFVFVSERLKSLTSCASPFTNSFAVADSVECDETQTFRPLRGTFGPR